MPSWWEDPDNPYIFASFLDEMRYEPHLSTEEKEKLRTIHCCGCKEQIDTSEAYLLKTLRSGWHINEKCLEDLTEWAASEFQRRQSDNGSGTR